MFTEYIYFTRAPTHKQRLYIKNKVTLKSSIIAFMITLMLNLIFCESWVKILQAVLEVLHTPDFFPICIVWRCAHSFCTYDIGTYMDWQTDKGNLIYLQLRGERRYKRVFATRLWKLLFSQTNFWDKVFLICRASLFRFLEEARDRQWRTQYQ